MEIDIPFWIGVGLIGYCGVGLGMAFVLTWGRGHERPEWRE